MTRSAIWTTSNGEPHRAAISRACTSELSHHLHFLFEEARPVWRLALSPDPLVACGQRIRCPVARWFAAHATLVARAGSLQCKQSTLLWGLQWTISRRFQDLWATTCCPEPGVLLRCCCSGALSPCPLMQSGEPLHAWATRGTLMPWQIPKARPCPGAMRAHLESAQQP